MAEDESFDYHTYLASIARKNPPNIHHNLIGSHARPRGDDVDLFFMRLSTGCTAALVPPWH